MLVPLSKIASTVSVPTNKTSKVFTLFLKYAHTHPDDTVTFHNSNMITHTHSDYSYLSNKKHAVALVAFIFSTA